MTLCDCKNQDGTYNLEKLTIWAKNNKIPINPKKPKIPRMEIRPNNRVFVQWTADHAFTVNYAKLLR
jgi:hypothetical protein